MNLEGNVFSVFLASLGYEPEGDESPSPQMTETEAPSYLKWAQGLHFLLNDSDGVDLFKTFLKSEDCLIILDFWFACEGLKKTGPDDPKVPQLIRVIYKRFIKTSLIQVSEVTRKELAARMAAKSDLDQFVFQAAQAEVESVMTSGLYPNFLKSDVYLSHVARIQCPENPPVSRVSASSEAIESDNCCDTSSSVDVLPTVPEETEALGLTPPPLPTRTSTLPLTKKTILATQSIREGYSLEYRPR